MKRFEQTKFREAMDYADEGHQGLHVFVMKVRVFDPKTGETTMAERDMAHLYDRNTDRLSEAAVLMGMREANISRAGRRGQNILLQDDALKEALRWLDGVAPPQFTLHPDKPSQPKPPPWKP